MSGKPHQQGEYPPDILMVGGTHDGEYFKGLPQDVLRVAKPMPRGKIKRGQVPAIEHAELATEEYRLRHFSADSQTLVLYALASLSDFDVQMSLIRGYRRP